MSQGRSSCVLVHWSAPDILAAWKQWNISWAMRGAVLGLVPSRAPACSD